MGTKAPNSIPYLDRPRRSLREVCFDITRSRGLAVPPCSACSLRDICAASRGDLDLSGTKARARRPGVERYARAMAAS